MCPCFSVSHILFLPTVSPPAVSPPSPPCNVCELLTCCVLPALPAAAAAPLTRGERRPLRRRPRQQLDSGHSSHPAECHLHSHSSTFAPTFVHILHICLLNWEMVSNGLKGGHWSQIQIHLHHVTSCAPLHLLVANIHLHIWQICAQLL